MAKLLKGAPVAAAINEISIRQAETLSARGIVPQLAIVRIGNRPDDLSYQRGAVKRCETVGVAVRLVELADDCTQNQLLEAIEQLNTDETVHGVLLLRPLPKNIDDNLVRNSLSPEKDVDGITDGSLAGVFTGAATGYPPCTARACMEILNFYDVSLTGKNAVVVGRSLVVGKPAAMLLLAQNATVTVCHTRTQDLAGICRKAEVLVVSAGKAGTVNQAYLSPGQVVIDVGIHVDDQGNLCGDVCFNDAEPVVESITPVPGGVGTVTTSVLVAHVVQSACRAAGLI